MSRVPARSVHPAAFLWWRRRAQSRMHPFSGWPRRALSTTHRSLEGGSLRCRWQELLVTRRNHAYRRPKGRRAGGRELDNKLYCTSIMRLQLFDAEPRGRCAGATAAHAGFGRKGRLKVLPQLASLCTCRKNYARFRQFFSVPVSPDVPTAGVQHDAIGSEGMPR
jgi:hypothetical protein